MIEYTLLNVLIIEKKIYCGPDKFYGRSKFGQYDEVKNRAPFNPQKTEGLLISRKQSQIKHRALYMNNIPIQEVSSDKHLGLLFNNACQWGDHIDTIMKTSSDKLNTIRSLKFKLDRKSLQTMHFSFVRHIIEYADIIWDNCPNIYKEKLEKPRVK